MARKRTDTIANFWAKVAKSAGCWLWTGSRLVVGYGEFRAVGSTKKVLAHRFSYALHKGPIPAGLLVRHTCDVRLCVNPDHLLVGTQADNLRDMDERGRRVPAAGELHGRSVLSNAAVVQLRERYVAGENCPALAVAFGITPKSAHSALTGATWGHIPGAVQARPRCKLTNDMVRTMRTRHDAGESPAAIARDFPALNPETVRVAILGITWKTA